MKENLQTYSAGVAKSCITPPIGTWMAGFGNRQNPGKAVYQDLWLYGLALSDGKTTFLLTTADLLFFDEKTSRRMRARVSRETGLPESSIVLACTHNHYGPVLYEKGFGGPVDPKYLDALEGHYAEVARKAMTERSNVTLSLSNGRCGFAVNRRKIDANGIAQWGPYPTGHSDHDVPILRVEGEDGTVAILYSYACHPTAGGGDEFGGDYVGFANAALVREYPGCTTMFFLGCGGDQKPNVTDANGNFKTADLDGVRALGEKLASSVVNTLKAKGCPISGPLHFASTRVVLPFDQGLFPTAESLERAIEDARTKKTEGCLPQKPEEPPYLAAMRRSAWRTAIEKGEWARFMQAAMKQGIMPKDVTFEIQSIAFGTSLEIVTLAGEMCVPYSLRFKKEGLEEGRAVIPVTCVNEVVGYVAAKHQFPQAGYEVDGNIIPRNYPARFVEDIEDRIFDAWRKLDIQGR